MKISGAIFDLDGTLTDSLWVWDGVPEKFLEKYGKTPDTDMNDLKALNTSQIGVYFKEHYFQDSRLTPEQIINRFGIMGLRSYALEVRLMPGARDLLKQLKKQGVRMYILTANEVHLVKAALIHNRIYRYFDGIIDGGDPKNAKDNPDSFENLRQVLGTPKEETFVFEDSIYAIENAKKAGFPVVAMNNHRDVDDQDAMKQIADLYVEDYTTILDRFE